MHSKKIASCDALAIGSKRRSPLKTPLVSSIYWTLVICLAPPASYAWNLGSPGSEPLETNPPPNFSATNSTEYKAGYLDVTKAPYNADPTGNTVSTAGIQQAIDDARDYHLVCFFPSGTYKVDDTLSAMELDRWTGNSWAMIRTKPCVLVGSATGPRPVIKLKNNTSRFSAGKNNALIQIWARQDGTNSNKASDNFNQVFKNIDINLGSGNPGAIGIWHNSSQGSSIENVKIYSDDSNFYAGLKDPPGQGGGSYNIEVIGGKYGITLSKTTRYPIATGCKFENQDIAPIRLPNLGTPFVMVGFHIINNKNVPIVATDTNGSQRLSFIDGIVESTAATPTFIDNMDKRNVYLENIYLKGIKTVIKNAGSEFKITNTSDWTKVKEYNYCPSNNWTNLIGTNTGNANKVQAEIIDNETALAGPPVDLITRHIWDEKEAPSFEDVNGTYIVNVKTDLVALGGPANAKGDDVTDDYQAIQWAIDNCDQVFLPKGEYRVSETLVLGKNTKFFGAPRCITRIRTKLNKWAVNIHKPIITTVDDADATTVLHNIYLEVHPNAAKVTPLVWRAGRRSVVQGFLIGTEYRVKNGVLSTENGFLHVKGNGGGRWQVVCGAWTMLEAFTGHHDTRRLLVEDTTEPFYFYAVNTERSRAEVQAEIRNAQNVTLYYYKSEAGTKGEGSSDQTTTLKISDSSNVALYGLSGAVKLDGPIPIVHVVNSNDIRLTQVMSFASRDKQGNPIRLQTMRENHGNNTTVLWSKNPTERLSLFKRGNQQTIWDFGPPPSGIPNAPSNVGASVISNSQINVSWNLNSSNETTVRLQRRINNTGAFTLHAILNGGTTSYNDTGLEANTTYEYRVRVKNATGWSSWSNVASGATTGTVPAPLAPSNLNATAISDTQIDLAWTDNAHGASNEENFLIRRRPIGGTWANLATINANLENYSDTDPSLLPDTAYEYQIRALHGTLGNSAYSNTANATTLSAGTVPTAPANLAATAVSDTQIDLSWDDVSDETSYEIQRKADSEDTYTVIESALVANTTSYSDTGLTPGTVYTYQLRAKNATGFSDYSFEESAMTIGGGAAYGQNLVVNPSFESSSFLTNADPYVDWDLNGAAVPTAHHKNYQNVDGLHHLMVEGDANDNYKRAEQYVPISENSSYEVSAYIRTNNLVIGSGLGAYIELEFFDNGVAMGNPLNLTDCQEASTTGTGGPFDKWIYNETEITPPTDATHLRIRCICDGATSGKTRFDLISVSAVAPANLVKNPGFESFGTGTPAELALDWNVNPALEPKLSNLSSTPQEGSRYVSITPSTEYLRLEQWIDVTAGHDYTVSGHIKLTGNLQGPNGAYMQVKWYENDKITAISNGNHNICSGNQTGTQDWTFYTQTITAPNETGRVAGWMRLRLVCDDAANNPNARAQFDNISVTDVTVGNGTSSAPVLASIGDLIINEDDAITINLSATDPDGDDVTFSASGLPSFATLTDGGAGDNTGSIDFSPDYTECGTYNITITATDDCASALTDSETITLTVNHVNRAPSLASISDQTMTEGEGLDIVLSISDPDGDSLTLTASNLPSFCVLNTNTEEIQCDPLAGDAGIYQNITITVSDGDLSDSQSFTLTVNQAASGTNLILNPSFENYDANDPAYDWDENGTTAFSNSANNPDCDQNRQALIIADGTFDRYRQLVPITGGNTYDVSGNVRLSADLSGGNGASIKVRFYKSDQTTITGGTVNVTGGNLFGTTADWVEYVASDIIAPTDAAYLEVRLICDNATSGKVRFDFIQVVASGGTPPPPPPPPNLVLNPSFEKHTSSPADDWDMNPTTETQLTNASGYSPIEGTRHVAFAPTTGFLRLEQFVPVTAGKFYTVSGHLRLTGNLQQHNGAEIEVKFYKTNKTTVVGSKTSITQGYQLGTEGWTEYTTTGIEAPANAAYMRLRLICSDAATNAGARARYDMVTVTEE